MNHPKRSKALSSEARFNHAKSVFLHPSSPVISVLSVLLCLIIVMHPPSTTYTHAHVPPHPKATNKTQRNSYHRRKHAAGSKKKNKKTKPSIYQCSALNHKYINKMQKKNLKAKNNFPLSGKSCSQIMKTVKRKLNKDHAAKLAAPRASSISP